MFRITTMIIANTQLILTCRKSTIETLEPNVNYLQSQQTPERRLGVDVIPFSTVSIVDFELVDVRWTMITTSTFRNREAKRDLHNSLI